jgi:hypothetical protein
MEQAPHASSCEFSAQLNASMFDPSFGQHRMLECRWSISLTKRYEESKTYFRLPFPNLQLDEIRESN